MASGKRSRAAGSIGTAAIRIGKTRRDFAARTTWRVHTASGTRLDVFCNGGHVETFVNGTKVNEAFDVTPQEGRIQLQTELAEVFYRRWELWPLDKGPKPAPAKQD